MFPMLNAPQLGGDHAGKLALPYAQFCPGRQDALAVTRRH